MKKLFLNNHFHIYEAWQKYVHYFYVISFHWICFTTKDVSSQGVEELLVIYALMQLCCWLERNNMSSLKAIMPEDT